MADIDDKKRKRLERNRESARECRKRKKLKKDNLKADLARLEGENLQLRLKLQVGHETNDRASKSAYITNQLETLVREGGSENDIHNCIRELQERFSDYGRDRRSAIDFHVNQLRRCLQPTQTTRAILWLMSVVPNFHDETGEFKPKVTGEVADIWRSLMDTLKLSPAQKKQMVSFSTPTQDKNDPFIDVNQSTQLCNTTLERIVAIICNKNESLDNEMSNMQTILSARQIAKFIIWIDQNPACMQMLECLWPHISNTPRSNAMKTESSGGKESAGGAGQGEDSDYDSDESDESH